MDGGFWLFSSFFFPVPAVVIWSLGACNLGTLASLLFGLWCFCNVLVQVHLLEVAFLKLVLYRCMGWGFVDLFFFVDSGGN